MPIILAVDDDIDDLQLLEEAIKSISRDLFFVQANNGKDALSMLDELVPDFIFLDINMPIMNGLDCLRLIRKISTFKRTPIIMVSTSISPDDKLLASEFNAAYIQKPNNFRDLASRVADILKIYSGI